MPKIAKPLYPFASYTANYFLERGSKEGWGFTNFALNKLTYIAQGWALAQMGKPLFEEEAKAWKFGPVIPSIYHEFKRFGSSEIPANTRAHSTDPDTNETLTPHIEDKDENLNVVLNNVWGLYADLTFESLKDITHRKGTPWHSAWNKEKGYKGTRDITIPKPTIKKHFEKKISEYEKLIPKE